MNQQQRPSGIYAPAGIAAAENQKRQAEASRLARHAQLVAGYYGQLIATEFECAMARAMTEDRYPDQDGVPRPLQLEMHYDLCLLVAVNAAARMERYLDTGQIGEPIPPSSNPSEGPIVL